MRKATKQGIQTAVKAGKMPGRRPAGFKVVDGKFVLDELGERAVALVDRSVRAFAAELGLPLTTAYQLQKNLKAFKRGGIPALGQLVMARSDRLRAKERLAEERAQKKRGELRAWLTEAVPARFGR